eukprot:Colp12_sorted_trinity150504_noHs@21746
MDNSSPKSHCLGTALVFSGIKMEKSLLPYKTRQGLFICGKRTHGKSPSLTVVFENFNDAQELFISSIQPMAALQLRRDLLQWDQAVSLAKTLAPDQLPYISREYAQQLEFKGDYAKALQLYETGLTQRKEDAAHNTACNSGIARCAIAVGDIGRGVRLAAESNNRQLCRECAGLLEGLKQFNEAAGLYEKGQYYDRAAASYMQNKNYGKVCLESLLTLFVSAVTSVSLSLSQR